MIRFSASAQLLNLNNIKGNWNVEKLCKWKIFSDCLEKFQNICIEEE